MKKILCIFALFNVLTFGFIQESRSNETASIKKSQLTTTENEDYIVVREFHDGIWWLVYYNEDGSKIMEIPDPWQ